MTATTLTLTPTGIRTDIVARLRAAGVADGNVYDSRQADLQLRDIPAVVVHSVSHDDDNQSLGGLVYDRHEVIGILGIVTGSSDDAAATAIDAIEILILRALLLDMEWTQTVTVERIRSRSDLEVDSKGRIGRVALELTVRYSPDYEVDLTSFEFERLALTTQPTDPDGADVSERVIELETA